MTIFAPDSRVAEDEVTGPLGGPSAAPREPACRIRVKARDIRKLRSIVRNSCSPGLICRARVLLLAAEGKSDSRIAEILDISPAFAGHIVHRFLRSGWLCLENELQENSPHPASEPRRKAKQIGLTGGQKRQLQRIVAAGTSEQRMVLRARIVLSAAAGDSNSKIARDMGIDVHTVRKWRDRYWQSGIEGLYDSPRSGRPFVFDSQARQEVFTAVVGDPPEPYATWSLDLIAKHLVDRKLVRTISIETVSSWLRTADIKPHRVRGWLNSKDPDFREKRDRINRLYLSPPSNGELICVDEKTGIQALERVRKDQPASAGRRRRVEWEYKRHGTANLLASFNVRTGQVISEIVDKNDSDAFLLFLTRLMQIYPVGDLHIILDNGSTHRSKKTAAFFEAHKRLVPIFTPTHASWLNQVEIWFSVLSRHALRKVSFSSREALIARIQAYVKHHNQELAVPYEWSENGKPLKGATAKRRRRSRSIPRDFQKAHQN